MPRSRARSPIIGRNDDQRSVLGIGAGWGTGAAVESVWAWARPAIGPVMRISHVTTHAAYRPIVSAAYRPGPGPAMITPAPGTGGAPPSCRRYHGRPQRSTGRVSVVRLRSRIAEQ